MLIYSQEILAQIQEQGKRSYPFEGCGLLLGRVVDGHNSVQTVYSVPNRWEVVVERRVRFRISDSDMLDAEFKAAELELDVIGIFHSHPDHPPVASSRDLAWATWPGYSYLITEIVDGKAGRSRSWQLQEDRQGFYEESISLQD